MPLYTFVNPHTEEEIDVTQSMKEPHVYIDENGLDNLSFSIILRFFDKAFRFLLL